MNHDFYNQLKVVPVSEPVVLVNVDTAQVGAIVDHLGFNSATYVAQFGTMTDAGVTTVLLLEEGDASNLSDAAAVADADLIGTELGSAVTQANDNVTRKLGYKGRKRYTRLTMTPTGNGAGSFPYAAQCILAHGIKQPQTAP